MIIPFVDCAHVMWSHLALPARLLACLGQTAAEEEEMSLDGGGKMARHSKVFTQV
jgi:hypothetical protein